MWIEQGTINSKLSRASDEERGWLVEYLTFEGERRGKTEPTKVCLFNSFTHTYPAGFDRMVAKAAKADGLAVTFLDNRKAPCALDPTADLAWLRDYQLEAVAKIVERKRGILWLGTGAGKTEIAVGLTRALPCKWLALVHRSQLADDIASRFEKRSPGLRAGRVLEGKFDVPDDAQLVSCTYQSIGAALKHVKTSPVHRRAVELLLSAEGLIVDECFPAGTKVGDTPIERLRVGDMVPSYDQATRRFCRSRVLRVHVRQATTLVRVHFNDGALVCTEGHPFLTEAGWVPAAGLTGARVLRSTDDTRNMPDVQEVVRDEEASRDVFDGVPQRVTLSAHDGVAQPVEAPRRAEEDSRVETRAGRLGTHGARWERGGPDRPAKEAVRPPRVWLGDGVGGANRHEAAPLQDRHRAPDAQDRCRSGRGDTQDETRAGARHAEGPHTHWSRVDRVEVLQPGDPSFPRDGLVYNLHVDRTETYLVEGRVVHNCHTVPADTFYALVMRTKNAYYRVGLSGTPLARGDARSQYALGAIGPIVHRVRADTLIKAGVLARPTIRMVTVDQHSGRPTWTGAYGELVVRSALRNAVVVDMVKRSTKPAFVFVEQVDHGRALTALLMKNGIQAEFVWGSHSIDYRKSVIRRMVSGHFEVIVCSKVFNEGIDVPELRSVVIAGGMKSVIATLQRAGRGMRVDRNAAGEVREGGAQFEVWDILDEGNPWTAKHARVRQSAYQNEGFETFVEGLPISLMALALKKKPKT